MVFFDARHSAVPIPNCFPKQSAISLNEAFTENQNNKPVTETISTQTWDQFLDRLLLELTMAVSNADSGLATQEQNLVLFLKSDV